MSKWDYQSQEVCVDLNVPTTVRKWLRWHHASACSWETTKYLKACGHSTVDWVCHIHIVSKLSAVMFLVMATVIKQCQSDAFLTVLVIVGKNLVAGPLIQQKVFSGVAKSFKARRCVTEVWRWWTNLIPLVRLTFPALAQEHYCQVK